MRITEKDIKEHIQVKIDEREDIAKLLSKCDKRTNRYRFLRELYQYTQGVITGLNTLLELRKMKIKHERVYEENDK